MTEPIGSAIVEPFQKSGIDKVAPKGGEVVGHYFQPLVNL
ncbi:hypothetical protein JOD55_000211 [Arcanobacterium pluranimalium]|nr:hypothetical protein [Arcanobacterium pluranimalium]